ncbi:DUF885 domain-containing protein [Pedomonas mirosovicensis]|uniref:DUF885 domain-containing protein n=1 Tax=Pedomonas mirosovicensis TaxID=2908641 RepID=UPI00216A8022|nr:DUF885 domain-containing protein [Pedomonas mirosovicensis]MCH8684227.1 DUF885 domain-containing protein [Pedomonas mirosovicensis]
MKKTLRAAALCAALFATGSAHGETADQSSGAFSKILSDHWAWSLSQEPVMASSFGERAYDGKLGDLTIAGLDKRKAALEAFIQRLEAVPDASLSEQNRLNKAILLRELRDEAEGLGFGQRLMLFTTYYGWHSGFAGLPDRHPFFNKADYESYIGRLNDYARYNAEGLATSREAVRRGFVQACDAMGGFEKTIEAHIVDDASKSVFMKPFARKPANITDADWARLKAEAEKAVMTKVVPAYRDMAAFYKNEYAPNCRKTAGISATPDGAKYYAYSARAMTTTNLSPEEIHQIGLKEVARIRAEMDGVVKRSGFKGDRKAFIQMLRTDPRFYVKTPEELLMRSGALAKQIDGELPRFFGRLPRLPYTVKPIPADQAEGTTTAYYMSGLMQAGRAGTYAVNTSKLDQRPLFEMPSLTLHEAVPGHHLQIALQQELDLPLFRRHLSHFTAFTEGWGLYAERLGYDMGLYDDPYAEFGRLSYEMWRACRLVVDTGIHAKGWTKEQAMDFMLENTALSRHNIEAEVNRYISWPGQALAYKIGELKIRELRAKAEKALGERFDIRAFHDAVLENGSVPLDVLESHINGWIAKQQQQVAQKAA